MSPVHKEITVAAAISPSKHSDLYPRLIIPTMSARMKTEQPGVT